MLEKSSHKMENIMRSVTVEMREGVSELAGPRLFAYTRESWLARASRKSGVSYRRVKGFFYQEYTNPSALDVERIRAALKSAQPRNEAFEHADTLERAARSLETIDADFHGADIHRLRDAARQLRGIPPRR